MQNNVGDKNDSNEGGDIVYRGHLRGFIYFDLHICCTHLSFSKSKTDAE